MVEHENEGVGLAGIHAALRMDEGHVTRRYVRVDWCISLDWGLGSLQHLFNLFQSTFPPAAMMLSTMQLHP